jgi:site-specific recombinase XerD
MTKETIKYLKTEEIQRLFAVITSVRDKAIFRIAYHRGLRAREVGMLQLADYRPEAMRLYVHREKCRKKNTSGEYLLVDAELRVLKAWLKERGPDTGPLFLSRRGTAISRQMLDVLMKKYCSVADIPREKAHFHALRHSTGTHLLERGRDIAEVQGHLGHVNIANTMIYAQITNKHRDRMGKELRDWR